MGLAKDRVAVVSYCQQCLSAVPVKRQDSQDWKQIRELLSPELFEKLETYSWELRQEIFRLRKQVRVSNKSLQRVLRGIEVRAGKSDEKAVDEAWEKNR